MIFQMYFFVGKSFDKLDTHFWSAKSYLLDFLNDMPFHSEEFLDYPAHCSHENRPSMSYLPKLGRQRFHSAFVSKELNESLKIFQFVQFPAAVT